MFPSSPTRWKATTGRGAPALSIMLSCRTFPTCRAIRSTSAAIPSWSKAPVTTSRRKTACLKTNSSLTPSPARPTWSRDDCHGVLPVRSGVSAMKVAVLGSGVVGVTTAWWLRQAGHDVLVVDRNPGPGQETSRAGGAQLSVSYAEPWATREAPLQVLRSLFHDNAPMRFRPRADWRQWWWGLAYLRQCWPDRLEPNVRAMVQLSAYSLMLLRQLREELGIDYQQRRNGVLNFYRDATDLERSQDLAQILRNLGVDRRVVSVEEMVELEPALAPFAQRLAGGDYTADDESGDGWLFTRALAGHARDAGVRFLFSHTVTRLIADEGRIRAAELVGPDGLYGDVRADAFVVAAGVHAPALIRPLGLSCNV